MWCSLSAVRVCCSVVTTCEGKHVRVAGATVRCSLITLQCVAVRFSLSVFEVCCSALQLAKAQMRVSWLRLECVAS